MNRLIREKSPYLIQHAHNPVDWYPWGPEAFEKARREEKPLFLSIGYSTCHWCHVMAHESFEDPHVAGLLNEAFVPVKVDREERPDIDQLYMRVCHMMTGSGGWPLTILMTADGKPFYAGTYLPKESRFGRMGMLELIPRIKQMWDYERGRLYALAERVTQALQEPDPQEPGPQLGPAVLQAACRQLESAFDEQFGGFGGAPKFPTPHTLAFLLRYWKRTGEARPLAMVEKTLAAMRRGGIFDQLGFGFHRYSTDAEWKVPHFEKMLYDQALLVLVYLEAFQATGRPEYRRTAEEVIEYVLRDLTHPEGAFLSAVDADSEGEEGRFYLWSEEEVRRLLDPQEAGLVIRVFNLRRGGNFHDPSTPRPPGANILHPVLSPDEAAAGLGLPPPEAEALLESARRKLLAAREQRVHPGRDDKVLTDWNGLMIAALARAAAVLDRPRYGEAAERAMEFLLARLRDPEGRLLHRWRDGEAAVAGQAADYACLTWGVLELYGFSFRTRHLELALRLTDRLLEDFWDAGRGGFYITARPAGGREADLPVRPKELYDGAIPSANSVALLNLLRLARLTGKTELEEKASRLVRAFSRTVLEHPSGYTQFLCAVDFALGPACELVIAGPPDREDTRRLVRRARERFLPGLVMLLKPAGPEAESEELAALAPYTARLPAAVDQAAAGPAVAFVCRDFTCGRPTPDAERMIAFLEGESRAGAGPDGG